MQTLMALAFGDYTLSISWNVWTTHADVCYALLKAQIAALQQQTRQSTSIIHKTSNF